MGENDSFRELLLRKRYKFHENNEWKNFFPLIIFFYGNQVYSQFITLR